MDKRIRIAGIIAALAASAVILSLPSDPFPPLPGPETSSSKSSSVTVLATGLDEPRSIAVAGNMIYVAEKSGALRVVQDGILQEEPLISLRAADLYEAGLLAVAIPPDYESERHAYLYYTHVQDDKLYNKILRITEQDGRLAETKDILDMIPGSQFSNGADIAFGPDGMLYAATGSLSDSLHLSQDPDSLAGKILRMAPDGSVPPDNPAPGSYVYASGLRNPQAIAWDADGTMYAADAGPSKNDEINVIRAGANYGWPKEQCSGSGAYERPAACYDPAIGPGGIAIYTGSALRMDGMMVIASLRAPGLYAAELGDLGANPEAVLGGLGRVRDVAQGPDGLLYLITSNTDGRGFPGDSDDRLVRVER